MYESEWVRASCVCVGVYECVVYSSLMCACLHWDWWMCVCRIHMCLRATLTDDCVCACVCACELGWQATLAYLSLPVVLVITQTISQKILQVCVWIRHTNTHIYTYIKTCIQTNKNNFTCINIFIYIYMYMHIPIYMWHTCMQSHICEYLHTICIREHIAQIFQVCVCVCVCMCICIDHTKYVHTRPHVCPPPGVIFSTFVCVHVACMHSHTHECMYLHTYKNARLQSSLRKLLCQHFHAILTIWECCACTATRASEKWRALSRVSSNTYSHKIAAPLAPLCRARTVSCSSLEHKHTHTQYTATSFGGCRTAADATNPQILAANDRVFRPERARWSWHLLGLFVCFYVYIYMCIYRYIYVYVLIRENMWYACIGIFCVYRNSCEYTCTYVCERERQRNRKSICIL